MKVNILILNYNGRDLLRECLPSVVRASQKSKRQCVVSVVDNASTDDSVSFVKAAFPSVKLIQKRENRVLCSYNDVVKEIDEDAVIFLNNDIKVDEDFVDPLVDKFMENDDAFLVGPKCLSFDRDHYEGARAKMMIKWGMFQSSSRYPGYEKDIDSPGLTMQSALGAFDRLKFLELGGFDEIYLPGIMEDADLCFRAWRRGFRAYYEPRSLIFHKGQVSFHNRFGARKTRIISHRNTFLFMWKNIQDPLILLEHILFLVPRLVHSLILGKAELFLGFVKALPLFPAAIHKRRRSNGPLARRDKEILNAF